MGLGVCIRYTRIVLLDICLNLFNLILSFININYFMQTKETERFGYLSLFLMWCPGLVTSLGFLVLYFRGVRAVSELEVWKLVVYPLSLLILYPALPLLLTIYYLFKNQDKYMKRARLARLFSAFLDHGPQFVLRVVVVVLSGVPHRGLYGRDDVAFIAAMVLSFLSLVLSALVFNERQTNLVVWKFVSAPMFATIFGGRAFTLAVLVREVLEDGALAYLWVLFILVLILVNIGLFRLCGQDWIRSIVFSFSSLLIPAGYTNDPEYYQLPNQNLLKDQTKVRPAPRLRSQFSTEVNADGQELREIDQEQKDDLGTDEKLNHLVPMSSGKYLLLHILSETVMLGVCSVYIWLKSDDTSKETSEALVLPQVLCVIPGLLFGVSRSVLYFPSYADNTTLGQKSCDACQTGVKVCLTASFAFLGFCSLVPALLWTFIYKLLD